MNQHENKHWLYQKYIKEKLSTRHIAQLCNCSNTLIRRKLREFKMPIRTQEESQNIRWEHRSYRKKEWLLQKYITENLSIRNIADLCHASMNTICVWLKKFNIPVKEFDINLKRKEHAEYIKAYYRKHPEKNRTNVHRWRKAKPYGINRKPEKRCVSQEWKEIIINFLSERDGWKCFYCKKDMTWNTISIDHVISPWFGGEHRMDNLRLVHKDCNSIAGITVRKEILAAKSQKEEWHTQ